MDDDIRSQPTGQPYVTNLRHEQAGQDGGDEASDAVGHGTCQGLDVQRVVQENEGFDGHFWPGRQASGAALENTEAFKGILWLLDKCLLKGA